MFLINFKYQNNIYLWHILHSTLLQLDFYYCKYQKYII